MGRSKQYIAMGLVMSLVAGIGLSRAHSAPQQPTVGAVTPINILQLTEQQMVSVKVAAVGTRAFPAQSEAMGAIALNDDRTVQVFPAYQGKILSHKRELGDDVRQGETLYTVDSPDLIQAESTLIASAGVRELTTHALDRARRLLALQGLAEKDYQQAVADQQTAEANDQAARRALHLFGKSEADADRIVATRQVDSILLVPSPLTGKVSVVAMSAAVGTWVQPGAAPAPYAVSDLSTLWMLANVTETDIPSLHSGAKVEVHVQAYPNEVFQAQIDKIGVVVDLNTHRLTVRCVVQDRQHRLHPGMMATFTIYTAKDSLSAALPQGGVVREGDGSYTVWVMTAPRRFERRLVRVGVQQGDWMQILEGLKPGERVATDGAIFLSNAFAESVDN